jgi:BirA family biotin operon repressor/biotin-[acetyl-CoA-carboxylase] ligase
VGVAAALGELVSLLGKVKWPNDVILDGKKAAGILIEVANDESGEPFAVVGIGANVNHTEFPEELAEKATSLQLLTGRGHDRTAVAALILNHLRDRVTTMEGQFSELLEEATRRSSLVGSWVEWTAGGGVALSGTVEGLDHDGNLLLREQDGYLRKLSAGEVTSQSAPGALGRHQFP